MEILFLDDMEVRHRTFKRLIAHKHNVTYVGNDSEAKTALAAQRFNVVFLDHDLAEDHYAGDFTKGGESGQDVVRFIVDKLPKDLWPKNAIIHSLNPDGSKRMFECLIQAGISSYLLAFGSDSFNKTVKGL